MDPINPVAGNPEAVNPNPQIPEAPKDNHGITIAALAIFILLSLAAVAFLYYQNQQLKTILASYQSQPSPLPTVYYSPPPSPASSSATPKACTQEAKLCPNGTYVGRTGPNCEFAPCPTP